MPGGRRIRVWPLLVLLAAVAFAIYTLYLAGNGAVEAWRLRESRSLHEVGDGVAPAPLRSILLGGVSAFGWLLVLGRLVRPFRIRRREEGA